MISEADLSRTKQAQVDEPTRRRPVSTNLARPTSKVACRAWNSVIWTTRTRSSRNAAQPLVAVHVPDPDRRFIHAADFTVKSRTGDPLRSD